jgi:hypothetical protein
MWDGQWHVDATLYAWAPYICTTAQLPPVAGGGNPTVETTPSGTSSRCYPPHFSRVRCAKATGRSGLIWST